MAGLSSLIKVYQEESQSAVLRESESDVYFGIPDSDNDYGLLGGHCGRYCERLFLPVSKTLVHCPSDRKTY